MFHNYWLNIILMSLLRYELPALLLLWICEGMVWLIVFTSFVRLFFFMWDVTLHILNPPCDKRMFAHRCLGLPFYPKQLIWLSHVLCWTSIPINLLPFGQNSSGVLFSSVSSTSSAQGMVANWHHTAIQDLWDSLSQTEGEPFLSSPPPKPAASLLLLSCSNQ